MVGLLTTLLISKPTRQCTIPAQELLLPIMAVNLVSSKPVVSAFVFFVCNYFLSLFRARLSTINFSQISLSVTFPWASIPTLTTVVKHQMRLLWWTANVLWTKLQTRLTNVLASVYLDIMFQESYKIFPSRESQSVISLLAAKVVFGSFLIFNSTSDVNECTTTAPFNTEVHGCSDIFDKGVFPAVTAPCLDSTSGAIPGVGFDARRCTCPTGYYVVSEPAPTPSLDLKAGTTFQGCAGLLFFLLSSSVCRHKWMFGGWRCNLGSDVQPLRLWYRCSSRRLFWFVNNQSCCSSQP